ncbi:butyryl-CoA:acetate CoA-transferase family protein [Ancylostoma ceylanicum]|uniref:Butyryl-CoA:acetate CoA-transferase family protein n=1 Tax=Ancylostoma ceylanicum TaxID=53326 RepID=A0A0D6M6P3_9BILA|nr:butyryl-CoA:acetate CoA-transferase family protein [Ancylostoma ceylanicum]
MRWTTVLRRSLMPLSSRLSTPAIGKTPQRMTADEAVSVIASSHADYIPIFLSDMPSYFYNKTFPVDVALISVTPPDKWGYCSVGVNVDTSLAAIENAKKVIAIINPKVPRTHGNTLIHQSRIDSFVEVDREIYGNPEGMHITEEETKIGKLIAENLVDDGATLQLGIGAIPDSTLLAMKNHKDLGIHTELLGDGVIDLIELGVINNSKKTVMPGKVVTSFGFGTQKFYKFLHDNPMIHFDCCSWTNHSDVVRANSKMTCINSGIEIDITGQIASDSIGKTFYSGFGGQVDFMNASATTYDGLGKAIIALTSRTNKGKSKITTTLAEGAGVVTTRGHVRYVVTEYGIANLGGKNVRQRAYALIQIAHPDDRERLEKEAFQRLKCMPSP